MFCLLDFGDWCKSTDDAHLVYCFSQVLFDLALCFVFMVLGIKLKAKIEPHISILQLVNLLLVELLNTVYH